MSTWYDAFWPALKSVIQSAWPEIPAGQLFDSVNIRRRDWTNLLDTRQIVGSWVIVMVDVESSDQGPVNRVNYKVTATISFITPHVQGVTANIITHLESLKQALLDSSANLGTPQKDEITIEFNAKSEINTALLDAVQAFQSGDLVFPWLVVT